MPADVYNAVGDALNTTQTLSFSVDVGSNPDRVLLVLLVSGDASNHDHPNAPTYNGVALTQLDSTFYINAGDTTGPDNRVASLWKLDDPAAGSNTLAVDVGAVRNWISMSAVACLGAATTSLVARSNDATATNNNPSVTATPNNANSLLVGLAAAAAGAADPYTPGTGVTEQTDSGAFTTTPLNHAAFTGTRTGSGSQTIDATQSSTDEWVMWFVEVTTVVFAFFDITNMPADFGNMETASIEVRARTQDATGAIKLYAQLFQSDETTTLSDEVQCASISVDGAFANFTVAFTGLNTSANKSVWDAARLRLRWSSV